MTSITVSRSRPAEEPVHLHGDTFRLCIGWSMLVTTLSLLVAFGKIPGDGIPWPLAWFLFLPSLVALAKGADRRSVFTQFTLAALAAMFITATARISPVQMLVDWEGTHKVMPVAFAVLMTAIAHIYLRMKVARRKNAF